MGRRLSHGENTVFNVTGRPWVLRVHRADYHPTSRIHSELDAMDAARDAGFHVGIPQRTLSGERIAEVDGWRVSVLSRVVGRRFAGLGRRRAVLLGELVRDLHAWGRTWTPPADFDRPRWDREGLYGRNALWGDLEAAGVDPDLARDLRAWLDEQLAPLEDDIVYLHHDLHRGNLLWEGDRIGLIDWDDSGFGFPVLDLVIAVRHLAPPLRSLALRAYGELPLGAEDRMEALGLALQARGVAWLHSRRDVPRLQEVLPEQREKLVTTARRALP